MHSLYLVQHTSFDYTSGQADATGTSCFVWKHRMEVHVGHEGFTAKHVWYTPCWKYQELHQLQKLLYTNSQSPTASSWLVRFIFVDHYSNPSHELHSVRHIPRQQTRPWSQPQVRPHRL